MGKILSSTYLQWVTQIDIIRNKLGLEGDFETDVRQNYKINAESMNRLDKQLDIISGKNSRFQKDKSYQVNIGELIKNSYKEDLTNLLNEWASQEIWCGCDACDTDSGQWCDPDNCNCDDADYCDEDCDCYYYCEVDCDCVKFIEGCGGVEDCAEDSYWGGGPCETYSGDYCEVDCDCVQLIEGCAGVEDCAEDSYWGGGPCETYSGV